LPEPDAACVIKQTSDVAAIGKAAWIDATSPTNHRATGRALLDKRVAPLQRYEKALVARRGLETVLIVPVPRH